MLLTGSFARTIDEKPRIAIPKELRDAARLSPTGVLYVAPGTDGSLSLYPEETFAELAARWNAVSPTGREARDFSRLFFAAARRVELDRQSRIRVPVELATQAHLRKEAMLLGVQNHMELWDAQRWESYRNEKLPQYDAIAEETFRQCKDG